MIPLTTPLAINHVFRRQPGPWGLLLRLLLLTTALSVAAGVLATALLDHLFDARAPSRPALVAVPIHGTTGSRDPSVPDAASVFHGRETVPDEPVASF